jgi:hypothetical protein
MVRQAPKSETFKLKLKLFFQECEFFRVFFLLFKDLVLKRSGFVYAFRIKAGCVMRIS